jgi:hypothetical protein
LLVEKLFGETGNDSYTGSPISSCDSGKDRTLSSLHEECCQTSELLLPLGTGAGTRTVRGLLQQPQIPRILKQRDSVKVYFGRNHEILTNMDQIKRNTLALRRKQHLKTRVAELELEKYLSKDYNPNVYLDKNPSWCRFV